MRDEDTFDTWFSSGQWPYVITDYLEDGPLSRFFPTTVLETGSDLLRQWVARMIMLSVYRTDKVPFKEVYFHGMVNDEHNQKMSKSKGNVINPIEIISEFGSDALRMGIISGRSPAQSQAFNRGAVIAGRNFCNKLWNIARYIENTIGTLDTAPQAHPMALADHWILRQLDTARQTIDRQLDDYRFAEAVDTLYHVVWDDVADWYLEASKLDTNPAMLAYVLDVALRLAHPFAPFVTETIWQSLGWHSDTRDMAVTAAWPEDHEFNDIAAAEFDQLKTLITEARFVISELPAGKSYTLLYQDDSLVADNAQVIAKLARLKSVEHVDQPQGLRLAGSGRDAWLDIDEDTLYEHQVNLETRLATVRQTIKTLEGRLGNESYVAKAPERLVDESRTALAEAKTHAEQLQKELDVLSLR